MNIVAGQIDRRLRRVRDGRSEIAVPAMILRERGIDCFAKMSGGRRFRLHFFNVPRHQTEPANCRRDERAASAVSMDRKNAFRANSKTHRLPSNRKKLI
jgi:hypothetical protein